MALSTELERLLITLGLLLAVGYFAKRYAFLGFAGVLALGLIFFLGEARTQDNAQIREFELSLSIEMLGALAVLLVFDRGNPWLYGGLLVFVLAAPIAIPHVPLQIQGYLDGLHVEFLGAVLIAVAALEIRRARNSRDREPWPRI